MKIKPKKAGGVYRAFTLIELLVVVAILGILAGVVIMNLGDLTDRARMAAGQRFSHSIRTRLALDEVGNWALDRADGTITHDFSGWDNHGTIHLGTGGNTNLAAAFVPGVHGQAMSFDGVDDFVNTGGASILTPTNMITIEAWFNTATLDLPGNHRMIITNGTSLGSFYVSLIHSNIANPFLSLHIAGTQRTLNSHFRPTINTWYHVVGTFDGNWMRIHVNGTLRNSANFSGFLNSRTGNTYIGRHGTGLHWSGFIDEVRIFGAAMPTSYIQKRYVYGIKSLAANGGITEKEKETRIAELKNSGQLVIDLDSALAGNIDFSPYQRYLQSLALEASE